MISSTIMRPASRLSPDIAALPSSIRFTEGERRAFRARERDPRTGRPLTVSQWAERYRFVVGGAMPGRWRNSVTPFAVEPMDCWSTPHIREIYLCFAPQVVKTQIAFNCLGYSIDQDPGSAMYVMPDEKVTKRIARRRILPMIRSTPRLASLLSPRSDNTTTLSIRFVNGMDLMMAWATSVAEISSEDVRYFIGDEIAKWPGYSGAGEKKEAHPWYLGKVRTNTYPHTKKILGLSSPGAAPCLITELIRHEADEVRRFEVPCPICGYRQIMDAEHVVALEGERDPRLIVRKKLGRYSCDRCGIFWDDYMRNQAVLKGSWVTGSFSADGDWQRTEPIVRPTAVAFHLPSWYSQFMSLSDVAAAAIRGDEDPKKRMIFVTQHRAEEFRDAVEKKKESEILKNRTSLPSGMVPAGAIALTCGVDSHKWGFVFTIVAWMEDLTNHKILHGHLGTLEAVKDLIFNTRFQVENSAETMAIWRAAIDTGGGKLGQDDSTMTEEIYQWLTSVPPGIVYGVKGASHRQEARAKVTIIDKFPHSNKSIPGGLEVHILDTAEFKALIHWRLSREEGENQRFYFDADTLDTDDPYVRELLAEEARRHRNGKIEWVKVRSANHYLDATVYAHACADRSWQPSLQLMSTFIRQEREKKRAIVEKKTHEDETHPQARQSSNHPRRPDINRIRERLSERLRR